jgi:hypothetical protein
MKVVLLTMLFLTPLLCSGGEKCKINKAFIQIVAEEHRKRVFAKEAEEISKRKATEQRYKVGVSRFASSKPIRLEERYRGSNTYRITRKPTCRR